MRVEKAPEPAELIADSLSGDAALALWRRHYPSAGDGPLRNLAEEFRQTGGTINARPDLVRIAARLADLQQRALASGAGEAQSPDMAAGLTVLENYFSERGQDDSKKFPFGESYATGEKLIAALERETAMVPFAPVKKTWSLFKNMWSHIWDDMKRDKVATGVTLVPTAGALWLMQARLGPSSTVYLDPTVGTITEIDLNAVAAGGALTFDPALAHDIQPSCHDHLQLLLGRGFADTARDALTFGDVQIFPQHCSRLKTLATDAQTSLRGGYDFITERLAWFTGDRVQDIGSLLPKSHFVQAFNTAAHAVAEQVYLFDCVENIVIHSGLFLGAAKAAHSLVTIESESLREVGDSIHDFFGRTIATKPLSYVFALSAVAWGAASYDAMGPVIWAGLGGAVCGEVVHAARNRLRRTEFVQEFCAPVQEAIAGLAHTETKGEPVSANPQAAGRFQKMKLALAFAGAMALGGLISADASGDLDRIANPRQREMAVQASEALGMAAGGGAVVGTYVLVNVPQDAALHVIFGVAGGLLGMGTGSAARLFRRGQESNGPANNL